MAKPLSACLFWKNLKCVVVWSGLYLLSSRVCVLVTRNCTYAFPRMCISVNPRKSVIITYEFPRRRFSVNPHNNSTLHLHSIVRTFDLGAYFTEQYFTLHLHLIVLFTLVLILPSVRLFFTLAFNSTLRLYSIVLFTLVLILLSSTFLYTCI